MDKRFINTLKELSNFKISYALLRKPQFWNNSGDIDIIVKMNPALFISLEQMGYCRSKNSSGFIKFSTSTKSWIHLDINYPLSINNNFADEDFYDFLLSTKYKDEDGIYRIDKTLESLLYLFHASLNKGFINSKYRHLLYSNDLNDQILSECCFSKEVDLKLIKDYLLSIREKKLSEKEVIKKICKIYKRNNNFFKRRSDRIKNFLKGPRPIVFLGPDGAGKSTLVNIIKDIKWPNIQTVYMGPSRDSEMNKFFIKVMKNLEMIREENNKNTFIGFLSRVLWKTFCYFDFLQRILRNNLKVSSGTILICDRYPCDMYFRKPNLLNKILYLDLFLKPHIVFLCIGDPSEIHKRKPELTKKEIDFFIYNYKRVLNLYNIEFIELNTTEYSIEYLIKVILSTLYNLNKKEN